MNKTEFVRQTIDLVKQIETRFLELGSRLFKIREEKLWADSYDNYQEFLDAAKINHGHASILASIHKNYVIDGGINPTKLAGIGYSNLYEAIALIERDGVETAVVKADTLTRAEIKDEVRDQKHGEHEHVLGGDRWGVCDVCKKFIRTNLSTH